MRIGITGIGSMVGFHLAKVLLEKGEEVIGLDNRQSQNVDDLGSCENFNFSQVDISELDDLRKSFNNVNIIYHLAAISSERLVKENVPLTLKVNVMGTINCLEVCKNLGAKLIYASSPAVYLHPEQNPKESDAGLSGKFYGTTKFIGEEFCRLYARNFNLSFTVLRFARIYGPRMKRNPVYDMSVAFGSNKPVKLYESLQCEYDFIYVKDVVKALIMAQDKKWDRQEINIGTGKGTKLKEIYDIFCEVSGKKVEVEVLNDKTCRDVLNIDKAKSLGWETTYPLTEGLKETFQYFNDQK